ncbi:MAG: succinate dehydrogenase, hydrophobic membrane anchor protein [Pseudomonadales bacterium]
MVSSVTNVTSLTRSGLADYVVQRVTAVIIASYAFCVLGFFIVTPDVTHQALVGYFGNTVMVLFSTLTVLATAAHAWIGMWTVGTDYLRPHYFGAHATAWRLAYQAIVLVVLFVYVAWALQIFWSI